MAHPEIQGPELRPAGYPPACLIVGQAPAQHSSPGTVLEGKPGKRLARWSSLSYEDYLSQFDRVNLLQEWPGDDRGRGDKFPLAPARAAAFSLLAELPDRVLLLGNHVAMAFHLNDMPLLQWEQVAIMAPSGMRLVKFAVIPHPSGRSFWWLRKANLRKAKRFLTGLASGGTVG